MDWLDVDTRVIVYRRGEYYSEGVITAVDEDDQYCEPYKIKLSNGAHHWKYSNEGEGFTYTVAAPLRTLIGGE